MRARSLQVPALLGFLVLPAGAISFASFASALAPDGAPGFSPVEDAATTGVSWSVQEGADGGTVDATGRYTAPATAGTYHVVATSAANPDAGAIAQVTVSDVAPPDVIPASRRTTWSPGIPGGLPVRSTIFATIDPAYASSHGLTAFDPVSGTGNAAPAIQYAIDHCLSGQVVYLPAGTYRLGAGLNLRNGVVLRGAGPALTKLRLYANDWVIGMMPGWPTFAAAKTISGNLAKDAIQATVNNVTGLAVGDVVVVDQLDDTSYVFEGNCPYFKRTASSGTSYGPSTSATRSVGQMVEITAITGTTVTFSPGLHLARSGALSPQLWKIPQLISAAGVEDLYVTGGTSGNFFLQDAANCWIKNVESDGTVSSNPASDGTLGQGNGMTGDHVLMQRTFRCVVRDSYFHHATHVIQGGGAYGISFANYSSDNLIENNIVYSMNKPLTMRATGGGNVVAYNYIDDAWTSADRGLQETTLDLGHASFPHMELAEGNYAPQIATENVWGNSGWMTIFRNYASGKQKRTDAYETYQIAAIAMEVKAREMNLLGNVLGTAGQLGADHDTMQFEVTSNPPGQGKAAVLRVGHGVGAGSGTDDIGTYESKTSAASTYVNLLRVGNWDNVRNQVDVAAATPLPASLYLTARPAFFGANPWPWVDPAGSTKVNVLPAKQRFDSGTPVQ